jgi:hypothetical protein
MRYQGNTSQYYEHNNDYQLPWESAPESWLVYLNEPPCILYKYDRHIQKMLNEKLLCSQKVYLQFPFK